MAESNEYAIIYLLPEPVRSYHLDLWAKVEHAFHLTGMTQPKAPPHLTLKYSFEAMDVAVVEQALEAFCATTPPTPWSSRGFNHFITPGNFVIFLEVIPTPAVRASHANLLERLRSIPWMSWKQYDNADLHYHATIAHKGLNETNFQNAWSFVNAQSPPDFDLHLDNLVLLKINEDSDTVVKTYRLAG